MPLDYRAAMLNEIPMETLLAFKGRAWYMGEKGGRFFVGLSTRESGGAVPLGDEVILQFSGKPRLIEKDLVSVMGRYGGTEKGYGSAPIVHVDYYEVLPGKN